MEKNDAPLPLLLALLLCFVHPAIGVGFAVAYYAYKRIRR